MSQYIVTVKEGTKTRRYVLCDYEDEKQAMEIEAILRAEADEAERYEAKGWRNPQYPRPLFWFGARWIQPRNRANEMYRTLSISDVLSIKTVPDDTVRMTP